MRDFHFRPKQQVYDPTCRECKKIHARARYAKYDKSIGPKPKQIYTDEIKNSAKQMHQEGKGYIEIGRLLKIRPNTLRAWCDEQYRQKRNISSKRGHDKWYANPENRFKKSEYLQEQMKNNYEHRRQISRRSKLKNKENRKLREKLRMQTDMGYKIMNYQRGYIKKILKQREVRKSLKTHKLLGCTNSELKEYLEKQFVEGMTWENHSQYGWHVDHIQPLNVFDLSDPEQQRIAFHYTNLRPLWWKDNLSRNKGIRFENSK